MSILVNQLKQIKMTAIEFIKTYKHIPAIYLTEEGLFRIQPYSFAGINFCEFEIIAESIEEALQRVSDYPKTSIYQANN